MTRTSLSSLAFVCLVVGVAVGATQHDWIVRHQGYGDFALRVGGGFGVGAALGVPYWFGLRWLMGRVGRVDADTAARHLAVLHFPGILLAVRGFPLDARLVEFLLSLSWTLVLSMALSGLYVVFGSSLTNRADVARNFTMTAAATMVVISIVKESLALSLGMVGALSIVRFRAAIKEPEELTFLFLSIGIGVGMGANQRATTFAAVAVIGAFIAFRSMVGQHSHRSSYILTVVTEAGGAAELAAIGDAVRRASRSCALRRLDESEDVVEATYSVELEPDLALAELRSGIRAVDPASRIRFLDAGGLDV